MVYPERMSDKADSIATEALSLPPFQRARLIEKLYQSLRSSREQEIEAAWAVVSEQRIDAYEQNKLTTVSYEQLKQELLDRDR